MPEIKKKIPLFGRETDVTDVPVLKASEPWSEYELEDGSVLRVRNVPTSVLRIDGQYNADGTPLYLILTTPVVNLVKTSDHLRRQS
jgi:hypothetical protein